MSAITHGWCGKVMGAIEVVSTTPQVRYVFNGEGYRETNVDESVESVGEQYVCQECGVALQDHGDIEYRYLVHCDSRDARPVVEVEEISPFGSLEGRDRRTVQEVLVSASPVAGE